MRPTKVAYGFLAASTLHNHGSRALLACQIPSCKAQAHVDYNAGASMRRVNLPTIEAR